MESSTAVFQPVVAMFALTGPTTAQVPAAVIAPSNNLKNLFELPVLFYAACIVAYLTGAADGAFIALAWAYVALRALHSVIHCTINHVVSRFAVYAASTVVLWVMVALLAFRL